LAKAIESRDSLRDRSRDGIRNRLEDFFLTHLRPWWAFVNRTPLLARWFNIVIVGNAVRKAPARPLALSTFSPYTSWQSLTDRTWFARYLPPRAATILPPVSTVAELFSVKPEGPTLSDRSTLLFPAFAQWFTDGFLLTNFADRRRTHTTHQIDLNPLYGLTDTVTQALRRLSQIRGERGRLKSEIVEGEEWAPRLYDEAGHKKPEFADLPDPLHLPPRRAWPWRFWGRAASTEYHRVCFQTGHMTFETSAGPSTVRSKVRWPGGPSGRPRQ
jgi:prostaglandin-endoperoxide synthase 2